MANMEIKETKFQLPIDIAAAGKVTKTLNTKDTYVDKDIVITVNTPDADFSKGTQSVSATASIADNVYTQAAETSYPITLQADASSTDVTVTTSTAGWTALDEKTTIAGATATQATKTVYIKEGAIGGDTEVTVTGGNGVDVTKQSSAPAAGTFYVKADSTGSVGVTTAGWVDPTKNTAVSTNDTAYYSLPTATLNNEKGEGTYTTVNAPVLISGSGLFINEGYIENTYISLADLVPDVATVGGAEKGADKIHNSVSVYDKDGTLIAGTMADVVNTDITVTATGASANVSTVNVAPKSDKSKFEVTGSGTISGTASAVVGKTGYIVENTSKTGDIAGTATLNAEINVISISADKDTDGAVTPVIAQGTSTAKTNAISTTAPADVHYVVVNTAAIAQTTTITPTVIGEGYGTEAVNNATEITVTGGAAASGNYYVGIQNGSNTMAGSISGDNITIDASATVSKTANVESTAGITDEAPSGQYITIGVSTDAASTTVSGTITSTITEGYVTAADSASKTVSTTISANASSATKYIKVYEGAFTA